MKIAVIGCGSAGRRHIGNLLALGCEVAVVDIDPVREQAIRQEFGLVASPCIPDAWVIAAPYDSHLDWVEKAFRIQKPFFVEKPLGSLEQLPRWRALAAMDLPINQVGYQLRFHPVAQAMRAWVPGIDSGRFDCRCDMTTWPGSGYGPMLLEMSHELDLALSFGASPTIRHIRRATDSICEFTLDSGWDLAFRNVPNYYCRKWDVSGPHARMIREFRSASELGDSMYRDELSIFLARVAGRETASSVATLRDGLNVLEICGLVEARKESLTSWKRRNPKAVAS